MKINDKLVKYEIDENCKILYEEVTILELYEDIDEAKVVNEDGVEFKVDLDLINDEIQSDGYFYMSGEVFMKAYMVFEKKLQLDKVYAEDDLRRVVEQQAKFYKCNSSERDVVVRAAREQRDKNRSSEPVIPIFYN